MITLQYLQELGNYTLLLYKDLKEGISQPEIIYSDRSFIHSYRYLYKNLIYFITTESPLTDKDIIYSNNQYGKMSFLKDTFIVYALDIERYRNVSFEHDWFSLSTVLSDSELVELYLCNVLQGMLKDEFDCGARILINATLMHEYYSKVIKNEE